MRKIADNSVHDIEDPEFGDVDPISATETRPLKFHSKDNRKVVNEQGIEMSKM